MKESYEIKAEGKYEIETATYDGKDVTDQLRGKTYQAPPINKDDIVFKVTFRDKAGGSYLQSSGANENAKDSVKTGDEAPVETFLMLTAGMVIIIFAGIIFRYENNRKTEVDR